MDKILQFLTALRENNNREWFEQNKDWYLQVKAKHEQLLEKIIKELSKFDVVAGTPAAKDCIFRIYRDVRFSKDKLPYKTHMGAFIAAGGRKSIRPGYYLHIEPGNSMISGGVYSPQPDVLKKLRDEIYFNSETFKNILNDKAFKEMFGNLWEDKLIRSPKDYDPLFPDIDLLKYKSYSVMRSLDDKEVISEQFIPIVLDACKTMSGFNVFLNHALLE